MKGPNEDISLGANAVNILGGCIEKETEYKLFDESRKIVIVKKYRKLRQNIQEIAVRSRKKHYNKTDICHSHRHFVSKWRFFCMETISRWC